MRAVLKREERRLIPCTSYPFESRNWARYAPSWPVTPVMSAFFKLSGLLHGLFLRETRIGTCPFCCLLYWEMRAFRNHSTCSDHRAHVNADISRTFHE